MVGSATASTALCSRNLSNASGDARRRRSARRTSVGRGKRCGRKQDPDPARIQTRICAGSDIANATLRLAPLTTTPSFRMSSPGRRTVADVSFPRWMATQCRSSATNAAPWRAPSPGRSLRPHTFPKSCAPRNWSRRSVRAAESDVGASRDN